MLYDLAAEFADLKGTENVYDLYTGIGSIVLYLAGNCRQVVGIEEIPEAIEDARANAATKRHHQRPLYAGDVGIFSRWNSQLSMVPTRPAGHRPAARRYAPQRWCGYAAPTGIPAHCIREL